MSIYDVNIEQCVIGCILGTPDTVFECENQNVGPEDFFVTQHQIIYTYIKRVLRKNGFMDFMMLANSLSLDNCLDKVGGLEYLLGTIHNVPTALNIPYYARKLKEMSMQRNVKDELLKTQAEIQTYDAQAIVSFCENLKQNIIDTASVDQLFVDASSLKIIEEKPPSMETGFLQIDSACGGGLAYGTLTVLTGAPSSGKSTFINQIVANALSNGVKSFLYSGELTYQMLMTWFAKTVAVAGDLTKCTDFFGEYTRVCDKVWEKIALWIKDRLFVFSKEAKADEKNLNSVIEYLAVKKGVKLFVLDNLMTLEFGGTDKYEKQIAAVKAIKALAKKYDLAVILVAHPNKSSLLNRTAHVFDISGASEVPNLSDYVLKITRGEGNMSEILIMKNRITGLQDRSFKLHFSPVRKRFYSKNKAELDRDYGYTSYKEEQ